MKANQITILGIASILLFGFTKNKTQEKYTPPGTVKIGSHLFMDETEITNLSWQEYVYWTEKIYGKESEKYASVLPDPTVWTEPYQTHYYKHTAYRDYPVVGISWEQAQRFCKWRSERVMEKVLIFKEKYPNKTYPTKVTYRLPTIAEWESIASAGYSEKTQKYLDKKHQNSNKFNFKSNNNSKDVISSTSPVRQFWPNSFGAYQMLGNVSEMVSEKGVAKGGSWLDQKSDIQINTNSPYSQPSRAIGFRCICEVEFENTDS